jgi:Domain of unknown function (DUF4956)
MNTLQTLQQKYIEEFSNNVPLLDFIINIVVVALLVWALRWYYIRFGTALNNRRKFAANFLPLALATLLIIMIVKSSIALSLGLVGALSIVRFRTAIKDPEELVYLFFVIGLGLAGGANQPVLAAVTFVFILGFLYLNKYLTEKNNDMMSGNRLFVHINTDLSDLQAFSNCLQGIFPYVELRRVDTLPDKGMSLTFICKADTLNQFIAAKDALSALSEKTMVSMVEGVE